MGGRTKKYKQMEFVEYNCPGHYQKKGCNNRTNIREAQIENYILENAEVAMQQFLIKYEKGLQKRSIIIRRRLLRRQAQAEPTKGIVYQ